MKKMLFVLMILVAMALTMTAAMAAGNKAEDSVLHGSTELFTEPDDSITGKAQGDVLYGKAESHANAGTFVKQRSDGSTTTAYGVEAGVSASGTVAKGSFEAKCGDSDYNFKYGASGEVLTGKATAGMTVGLVDGQANLKIEAGARAIAAGADFSVGGSVGGVEMKAKAGVNVGIGATAKFDCSNGKVKIDVGASLGVGLNISVEVDIGAATRKVTSGVKSAWNWVKSWF